jgi:hypothetical protein
MFLNNKQYLENPVAPHSLSVKRRSDEASYFGSPRIFLNNKQYLENPVAPHSFQTQDASHLRLSSNSPHAQTSSGAAILAAATYCPVFLPLRRPTNSKHRHVLRTNVRINAPLVFLLPFQGAFFFVFFWMPFFLM